MTVLAATDFSDAANHALRYAAARAHAGMMPLTVVHCMGDLGEGFALKDYVEDSEELLEVRRREVEEDLETVFHRVVPVSQRPREVAYRAVFQSPAEGIVSILGESDYQLAVLGPTGTGKFAGLLVGSTAEDVVRSSAVPTLVVPPEWAATRVDRVLAPVDFSSCSRASLEYAAELARTVDAKLTVFHHFSQPFGAIVSFERSPEAREITALRKTFEKKLEELIVESDLEDVEYSTRLSSAAFATRSADEAIVEYADTEDIDLIVMGTHGRRGLERLFLGSTAFKVLRRARCPVLTVREAI